MAFGFPASHTERYSPGTATPDLRRAVRETFIALSWSVREETPDGIVASTSADLRSWGEKVFVDFPPDDAISVTSKCALPTQCLDWGKNKANVRKFLAEFDKHAQQPAPADGGPPPPERLP
jgi:hypothetical protein